MGPPYSWHWVVSPAAHSGHIMQLAGSPAHTSSPERGSQLQPASPSAFSHSHLRAQLLAQCRPARQLPGADLHTPPRVNFAARGPTARAPARAPPAAAAATAASGIIPKDLSPKLPPGLAAVQGGSKCSREHSTDGCPGCSRLLARRPTSAPSTTRFTNLPASESPARPPGAQPAGGWPRPAPHWLRPARRRCSSQGVLGDGMDGGCSVRRVRPKCTTRRGPLSS